MQLFISKPNIYLQALAQGSWPVFLPFLSPPWQAYHLYLKIQDETKCLIQSGLLLLLLLLIHYNLPPYIKTMGRCDFAILLAICSVCFYSPDFILLGDVVVHFIGRCPGYRDGCPHHFLRTVCTDHLWWQILLEASNMSSSTMREAARKHS